MVHVTHHVLHAYGDLVVDTEAAKKANYVRRVALVQHFQLSHYLVAYGWLDVQHDHLRRRGREVCHHTSIPIVISKDVHERGCGQCGLIRRADPLPQHIV